MLLINNIVMNASTQKLLEFTTASVPPGSIVANVFSGTSPQFTMNTAATTYAAAAALGYNSGGVHANPLFIDAGAWEFRPSIRLAGPGEGASRAARRFRGSVR